MTGPRHHIISRILAGLVALQLFAMPLFLVASLSAVKKLQHRLLHESNTELTTLLVTEAEFVKIQFIEEDEMLFNNLLYDIKSIEKSGGKYIITALADEKEASLIKINRSEENKSKKSGKGAKKLPLLFFELIDSVSDSILSSTNIKLSDTKAYLSVLYIKIPTPPPQVSSI